jgi:hypothetical protein
LGIIMDAYSLSLHGQYTGDRFLAQFPHPT